jgi:hypothetical protein
MGGLRHMRALAWAALPACALLAGCSGLPTVQPWEKGVLARRSMTFDADRLDSAYVEHTYSSKEGASGGAGVGGGGCGCN